MFSAVPLISGSRRRSRTLPGRAKRRHKALQQCEAKIDQLGRRGRGAWRNVNAERLGRLQIDDELELGHGAGAKGQRGKGAKGQRGSIGHKDKFPDLTLKSAVTTPSYTTQVELLSAKLDPAGERAAF